MTLHHPARDEIDLADVLAALGHPVRLQILRSLTDRGEGPCGAVSQDLAITKSTATHHWRVLREAGVIHQRPDGRNVLTNIRCDDLNARFPGLLDAILDRLSADERSGAASS